MYLPCNGLAIYRVKQFHTGIDIPEVKGAPVYATGNGVIIGKGYDSGYAISLRLNMLVVFTRSMLI